MNEPQYEYRPSSDLDHIYKNMEFVELEKNIYVYKNLIPDVDRLVQILIDSENNPDSSFMFKDWQQWGGFGTYVYHNGKGLTWDDIDSASDRYKEEKQFLDIITRSFYETTSHFAKSHGKDIPSDWNIMGPSISKYKADIFPVGEDVDMGMLYHTDYKYLEAEWPGPKFVLTCTMYLNDDYDGGGLSFILPSKKELKYKPAAGDIVVFPSGHPEFLSEDGIYFHGVNRVLNKDKYLVRCFYQKPFAGTDNYFINEEKYGKDQWEKMEIARVQEAVKVKKTLSDFVIIKEDSNDN